MLNSIGSARAAYEFMDDIMDNSDTDLHYCVELCLTYCFTHASYEPRQKLRAHLINRQLARSA